MTEMTRVLTMDADVGVGALSWSMVRMSWAERSQKSWPRVFS